MSKDLLIVVHGIRDMGTWGSVVKSHLASATLDVAPVQYGYFNALQFVEPLYSRRAAVRWVERRVRYLIANHRLTNPGAKISFLAHSFGAYVVAEILRRDPFLQVENLALCGSVLSRDYPVEIILQRVQQFVNDCGTEDHWPVVAGSVTWGYGNTGTFGFSLTALDRFHPGDHGLFFETAFINKYWTSLFSNNTVVASGTPPPDRPTWKMWPFVLVPFRWLQPILVIAGLWVLIPWLLTLLAAAGMEFSFVTFRHDFREPVIGTTPRYLDAVDDPLEPPPGDTTVATEVIRQMFSWKRWMKEAAKSAKEAAPPNSPGEGLVVVTSDKPFEDNYTTFLATVNIKATFKITDGAAFLVSDRAASGQYRPRLRPLFNGLKEGSAAAPVRPAYRQLDLNLPQANPRIDQNTLELYKPDRGETLLLLLQVRSFPAVQGAAPGPLATDPKDLGITVSRRQ